MPRASQNFGRIPGYCRQDCSCRAMRARFRFPGPGCSSPSCTLSQPLIVCSLAARLLADYGWSMLDGEGADVRSLFRGNVMAVASAASAPGFLDRERIIAEAGFNRWLVPPAALAIHLCIGMAYGFSVFWLPLSKAVGISRSVACPKEMSWLGTFFATDCDWKISLLGWTYTLFFVFLGT